MNWDKNQSNAYAWSAIAHGVLIAAVVIGGCVSNREPEPEPMEMRIAFQVAVPQQAEEQEQTPESEPTPPEPMPPEPTPPAPPTPTPPQPVAPPEPAPVVVSERPKIVQPSEIKKGRLVTNSNPQPQPQVSRPVTQPIKTRQLNVASTEPPPPDWQKRLDAGATPGPVTTNPAEDNRCRELIRSQLKEKWNSVRPVLPPNARSWPKVRIYISSGGRVTKVEIVSSSGNAELDAAAKRAASSISRFNGLSESFIANNPSVEVDFTLI